MKTNTWDKPEVAKAQRTLIEKQLQDPFKCSPFAAFLEVLSVIEQGGTFIDIGCGVGHYGVLLNRYRRDFEYIGCDASAAMIAEAKDYFPDGSFWVRPFDAIHWWDYDIVLCSQVLEYQPLPQEALKRLLEWMPHKYLILHRLRLTNEPSHVLPNEETYCGNRMDNYLWNLDDIYFWMRYYGRMTLYSLLWEHHASLVIV